MRLSLPARVAKRALRQRQLGAEARRGGRTLRRPDERFPRDAGPLKTLPAELEHF
jgi:hypothetical protein